MTLLEALRLSSPHIYFARISPNLKAAKELLCPLLKNPLSKVALYIVIGVYATSKVVKMLRTETGAVAPDPGEPADDVENKQLPKVDDALLLTVQDLMGFDGLHANRPIYTALNGKIYDLTSSREIYAHQVPYSLLAGCNANHVLNITCRLMGLSVDDLVERWEQCLNAEFNVVGYLIDDSDVCIASEFGTDDEQDIDADDNNEDEDEDTVVESEGTTADM